MSRVRLAVLLVGVLLLLGLGGLLVFDREQPGPTASGVAVPPELPPAAPEPPAPSRGSVAESVDPETGPGRQAALPEDGTAAATPESQSGEPATEAPASSQGEAQMAARPPASAPAEPTPGTGPSAPPVLPSFDVVRVEPSGEAVLAGRAEPRSRVRALDYNDVIGAVTADLQGQWVIVVEEPLAPGTHELGLEAETPSGAVLQSESLVIVTVPYPQVAEAPEGAPVPPRATEPPSAAPALEIPSEVAPEPGPPSTVAPESGTASQVAAEQGPRVVPRAASPPAAAPAPAPPSEIEPRPASEDATRVARAGPDRSAAESASGAPSGMAERVATRGTSARRAPGASPEQPLAVMVPRSGEGPSRVLQQPSEPREGLGEGTLVLETIDYAPNGAAYIGGRAAPEARLIVYLNERPAGYGRADSRGVWLVALDQAIAPGLHDLRVDQVEEDGKVVARVETPFSAAGSVVPKPDEITVVVQPGNSLWRIARRVYGKGLRYTVIFAANDEQIADPDLIYPGQIFVVPLEE